MSQEDQEEFEPVGYDPDDPNPRHWFSKGPKVEGKQTYVYHPGMSPLEILLAVTIVAIHVRKVK